jgi:hypothetical protein
MGQRCGESDLMTMHPAIALILTTTPKIGTCAARVRKNAPIAVLRTLAERIERVSQNADLTNAVAAIRAGEMRVTGRDGLTAILQILAEPVAVGMTSAMAVVLNREIGDLRRVAASDLTGMNIGVGHESDDLRAILAQVLVIDDLVNLSARPVLNREIGDLRRVAASDLTGTNIGVGHESDDLRAILAQVLAIDNLVNPGESFAKAKRVATEALAVPTNETTIAP